MELWTELLALLSQVVTPIWNELIQYIPLLLFGIIPLVLLIIVGAWRRNGVRNASRVPDRLPAGRMPEGMHLPGPSRWPWIAAGGLAFIFASLVFGATSETPARDASGHILEPETMITVSAGPNLLLLTVGLIIGAVAFAGWLMDATREYDQTEAGGHDLVPAEETQGYAAPAPLPDGVHLPPPSAWPFLAPIGLFFAFLGLALGPVLIVGGLAMAAIAAVGWTLDAGKEYHEVADGAHPDPEARDPERAFPKRLTPVYMGIASISILLTLGPWMLTLLPRTDDAVATGPTPTTTPYISAVSVLAFEQTELYVPADTPFVLTFDNKQADVEHNVQIFEDADKTVSLFDGEVIVGPATIDYAIDPLTAGEYPYICRIHPVTMIGTLFVL